MRSALPLARARHAATACRLSDTILAGVGERHTFRWSILEHDCSQWFARPVLAWTPFLRRDTLGRETWRMHTTRVLSLVMLLLTAAVLVCGCASSGGVDTSQLEGSWVLESFGAPNGLTPADPTVTSEMSLTADEAQGTGGVNSFSGPYEAKSDGSISFGPLAATEMAGPPAAMAQEARFFQALEAARSFELHEGKLVLSDSGNNTLVILAPK